MAEPKTLRWGLMGCARITERGLIPGIRASTSGVIAAIASRDGSTAKAWAETHQIPRSHGSYEALLDDPEIDAVYLPLPNELHRPWTFAAADAGKHVLCEKPLALDADEARAMVAHCRARGVLLMEAAMWRHQPRTHKLLSLVREGAIGTLRLVRASFSFSIEPGDWRLDPARGGGALWDVGTYGVSAARLFTGEEPEAVSALARFGPTGVDMTLSASLRFPGGVIGHVDCSFEQPLRCNYELVGDAGVIEVPDAFLPPDRPTAHLRDVQGKVDRDLTFEGTDQYAAMVDAFAGYVRDGRALAFPSEDGVSQMAALDRVIAAAREG